MTAIQEVFLEIELGEAEARQARDERVQALQTQGWLCTTENLYSVWGHDVFCLQATQPEPVDASPNHTSRRSLVLRSDKRDAAANAPAILEVLHRLSDAATRQRMSNSARLLGRPTAAEQIARWLIG